MGTITMSGFNNIDWSAVLSAVMQQEKQPLTAMQAQYTSMQLKSSNFSTLASKLGGLESSIDSLKSATDFSGRTATSTDSTTVTVSAGSTAMRGTYDVVVTEIARAQVTTSQTTVADKDTVVVATGGKIVINNKDVLLSGDTTLQQLADAVNSTENIGVTATVVSANGRYRMVLTANETGASQGFGVVGNQLEGTLPPEEGGLRFEFSATPAVAASDADITVNNVQVTSSSNTLTDVIPGTTITVLKKSVTPTVLTIAQDSSQTKTNLQGFITAYNDLIGFFKTQAQSSKDGATYSLSRESMTRSLRSEINSAILGSVTTTGAFTNLANVGVEFQRDGTLTLNNATFDDAAKTNQADIEKLFAGNDTVDGVFDTIKAAIASYTEAGGLVADARTRLDQQMRQMSDKLVTEESRLEFRRITLQKEYAAADSAIGTLNAQAGSLTNMSSAYRLY
jgi:flagellar hook-associated protein 2